jgi:hypothetical protein
MSEGRNEGIHVLEEFVCEAIAVVGTAPNASPDSNSKSAVQVIDEPAKPSGAVEGKAENRQSSNPPPPVAGS